MENHQTTTASLQSNQEKKNWLTPTVEVISSDNIKTGRRFNNAESTSSSGKPSLNAFS